MIELFILSIFVILNFIILRIKIDKKRFTDSIVDISVMLFLAFIFNGTYKGMIVAMVSGFVFSIYLYFYPISLKDYFKW
jgi:hypothetical protein